jgi:hypothetical protein
MKKNLPLIVALCLMCMSYTTSRLFRNASSPVGNTGAPKAITGGSVKYCTSCHGDFALNVAGGGVVATGLPSGTYNSGQVYNFSIKISHSAVDRFMWGFAIKAVNSVNNDVTGTFSTTNANAGLTGTGSTAELSHKNAQTFGAAANSYTYINLTWTAPAVPTANESTIKFYISGLACDASGDEAGDYVYSSVVTASLATLPITLNSFSLKSINDNAVNINWQTSQELNSSHFDIEKSINGNDWIKVGVVSTKGNSNTIQSYSFIDKKPASYNNDIYYRLKIVDGDGAYKYSSVETIKLKNAGLIIDNLSAQPLQNSSNGIFRVYSNNNKQMMISVTDMNGRLLYNTNTTISNGTNTIEIPADKISKTRGMILVRFQVDGFVKTFRQLVN